MIGELTLTDEELDKVLNNFEFRIDKEKDVPSEKAFEFVKGRFERKFRLLSNRIERAITEGFGSYIKQVRKGKGLSLQTVADLTGISPSYINRIEKSERKAPSYRIIEKLAKAFEVPIEEMLKIAGIKEDTTKVQGFAQVIYSNGFTINGRLIPNKQKEMIVEIITKMDEAVWGNDTKYRESIELMELINKYKELDK
ncbi:helix-turn-helix transcriptional regulator (plasmid) [Aneurinibacillus sp. Ricciae_BoGa-3]|nr:helix-turn-helix transcriptional regulator [Aneurinibacillus sp. Ricciae_BoGa-3]WCK56922.1 helix-turn-helix transcriptional regulator [Aneurinibacillus sp. Ricciae_BoGa-3]